MEKEKKLVIWKKCETIFSFIYCRNSRRFVDEWMAPCCLCVEAYFFFFYRFCTWSFDDLARATSMNLSSSLLGCFLHVCTRALTFKFLTFKLQTFAVLFIWRFVACGSWFPEPGIHFVVQSKSRVRRVQFLDEHLLNEWNTSHLSIRSSVLGRR